MSCDRLTPLRKRFAQNRIACGPDERRCSAVELIEQSARSMIVNLLGVQTVSSMPR